jgi:hypothetical protein
MKHILNFKLFEKKEEKEKVKNTEKAMKMIEDFKKDFGTELDEKFSVEQIKLLRKAFGHFNKKFLKNKIHKVILDDIGSVHGRWHDTPKKKHMTLNPNIFDFKKDFENGTDDIPYKEFIIVHEIGHCIDHIEKVSFSKKWQAISGWKKCDINDVIPDGYDRYIERRSGKGKVGHKKSGWVYKEGSDFCRKYSSKNPREDFADSFAFAVFKNYSRFKGEGCKKKLEILKKVICEID